MRLLTLLTISLIVVGLLSWWPAFGWITAPVTNQDNRQEWALFASLATLGTLLVAGYAAVFQLQSTSRSQISQLLLSMDARFESNQMGGARSSIVRMEGEARDQAGVERTAPITTLDGTAVDQISENFATLLRDSDDAVYQQINTWMGFYETLGMLCLHKKYIGFSTLYALYGGRIEDYCLLFGSHIRSSQKLADDEELWEYFLRLGQWSGERRKIGQSKSVSRWSQRVWWQIRLRS